MPLHVGVEYVFGITGRDDVRFCIKDFQGNLLREGQIITDPTISKEVWGIVPKLLASDRILVLLVDSRPDGQPSTIYEIPLDPAKPIRTLISIERKLS